MKHGRVFSILAIKGGVGKTTVATNLATTLAQEHNKKVLLIDANFTAPTSHIHVGLLNPERSIHDVLQSQLDPAVAAQKLTKNLHILAGTFEDRNVNPLDLALYMRRCREEYDFTIIDSSPNLNEEMIAAMNAADEIFVVTTPDHVALTQTIHAIQVAKKRLTYVSGIIMNMVDHKNYELDYKTIQEKTKTPVMGIIDRDANFLEALEHTTTYTNFMRKHTDANIEYKKLAAALTGTTYKDPRLKAVFKRMFNKKINQGDINRSLLMKSHY